MEKGAAVLAEWTVDAYREGRLQIPGSCPPVSTHAHTLWLPRKNIRKSDFLTAATAAAVRKSPPASPFLPSRKRRRLGEVLSPRLFHSCRVNLRYIKRHSSSPFFIYQSRLFCCEVLWRRLLILIRCDLDAGLKAPRKHIGKDQR